MVALSPRWILFKKALWMLLGLLSLDTLLHCRDFRCYTDAKRVRRHQQMDEETRVDPVPEIAELERLIKNFREKFKDGIMMIPSGWLPTMSAA
jgi:primosomal protein N'